ncbi:MAG: DUF58 domain-containing protein [Ilumatobacteraceae bacterium]
MAGRRSVPIPTGWLALIVALLAVPVALLQAERWIVVVVALVVVVVVAAADFSLATRPRDLDVSREMPATLAVGEPAEVTWLTSNRTDRQTRVTVADSLWPSFEASRRSSTFTLGGLRQHRFGAKFEPARRGRFPLGVVTVRTVGPMRLMLRQQSRDVPGSLAVMPAYPSRDDMSRRMRVPLESGIRSVRTRGVGTEFEQLREYRPGDDFRKVDWAATARKQRAVVREYRTERNQYVVALLDNGRVMAGTVAGAPRVEQSMDAVLALTQVTSSLGDNIGLLTFDTQVRGIVPANNSKSQFAKVAEAMYLLDPQLDEGAYGVAFNAAVARFRRRSLFVVFTDIVESVVDVSLLPALPTLTRRHLVMVAAVRDPDVSGWATETGHEAVTDAYRSASAVASLEARRRGIARLQAAGAVVVDAEPGRLATEVVDTYLDLKARGRL